MTRSISSAPSVHAHDQDRVPATRWLAVAAVAVGIFALVTAEQLPVGLLTGISSTLHVSAGTAGLLVVVPGVVAGIAAPLVPMVVGGLDRRRLLIGLIALMVAAHLLSAAAPNFAVLLACRLLVGLSIGGFWSIAGGIATRLVPHRSVPRATSLIFGGVAAAAVLGVPVGTLLGELSGWRVAFLALCGLGVLVLVALFLLLPRLPAAQAVELRVLTGQLRNPAVRFGVIATFLLVAGHFAAYTFISPALQTLSGIDERVISSLLLGYGVAGIVGNFVAGSAAGRNLGRTVVVISAALAATMALFPLLGASPAGGIGLLILWGLAYGGVSVTLQTWMLRATPQGGAATEAATSLLTSMFNLSIAFGALVGGIVVNGIGLASIMWLGAGLVALTVVSLSSGSSVPARAAGRARR